ncbi:MAG: hypothetical protein IV084_05535 [Rugosibacter sp.]|nr:hypothetical protein [Rugosibacter sp.]
MTSKSIFKVTMWFALSSMMLSNSASAAPQNAAPQYAHVAARYSTTSCTMPCEKPQASDWYFWRDENRVEIRNATQDVGEIWRRENKTRLSFVYVEPAHKRGIEYNDTDLRMINHKRSWDRLASIVSLEEIAKLSSVGETEILGHKAQRYSGKIDKRTVEVVWIPDLQLTAKVVNIYPDRQVTTELKSFLTKQDDAVATSDDQLSSYTLVDFADLGDMETKESMAWLKQATMAPGHDVHEH